MSGVFWTEDRIDALRTRWLAGETAEAIARALGATKNAVIGKAHRLRLTARESPIKCAVSAPGSVERLVRDARPVDIRRLHVARARLPELWASDKPLTLICQSLSLSKLAVERIAGELKLPPRGSPRSKALMAAPRSVPSTSAAPTQLPPPLPPPLSPAPPPTLPPAVMMPAPPRVAPLGPREPCVCRWPFGDPGRPGFRFCAAPRSPTRNYCDRHHAIAYPRVREIA